MNPNEKKKSISQLWGLTVVAIIGTGVHMTTALLIAAIPDRLELWHVAVALAVGQITSIVVGWTVGRHASKKVQKKIDNALGITPPQLPSQLPSDALLCAKHRCQVEIICQMCGIERESQHGELPPAEDEAAAG